MWTFGQRSLATGRMRSGSPVEKINRYLDKRPVNEVNHMSIWELLARVLGIFR